MKQNKIKLFFDIDSAAQLNKSGVGVYSLELLRALSEQNRYHITAHYFNFLSRLNPDLPRLPGVKYVESKFIHRKLFNLLRRFSLNIPIEALTRSKFKFAVFPNFTHKTSLFNTPYCLAVHDFTYLNYKSTVSKKNQKDLEKFVPKGIKRAAFIIFISQSVATEMNEHYPNFDKDFLITRIPPSKRIDISPEESNGILRNLGIEKSYIIFIGNREPRKNLNNLLVAYSLLPDSVKVKYDLVLVGSKGWNEGLDRGLLKGSFGKIIETGYIDDVKKEALISKASLLVLPSIYEGYGIPIVEAMLRNVPTAVSDIPVFREITKGNSNFFDPKDPENISSVIAKTLGHKNISQNSDSLKDLSWSYIGRELSKKIGSYID